LPEKALIHFRAFSLFKFQVGHPVGNGPATEGKPGQAAQATLRGLGWR
jgi:hypothetical protein